MKAEVKEITAEMLNMREMCLHIVVPASVMESMPPEGVPLIVELKKKTKKRSLSANAYCWVLIGKIADKINATKEEVYRRAIHEAGKWEVYTGAPQAMESLMRIWRKNGVGYQAEPLGDGTSCMLYYGSSEYDTKQMSKLIDWLVDEAEALGIDVRTPEERVRMLEEWEYATTKTAARA